VLRRALICLLAGCCLLAVAAPANAERLTLRDPRYDMWRTTADGDVAPATWSETSDLTRAKVWHKHATVVVRLHFVRLRRTGIYAQYAVRVHGVGKHRRLREVVVEAGPGGWRGQARVFTRAGRLAKNCAADHRIDYNRELVVVRLARACLDRPRRVRVNVNVYRARDDGVFFADNPHNVKAHARAWSGWVRRTRCNDCKGSWPGQQPR